MTEKNLRLCLDCQSLRLPGKWNLAWTLENALV